MTLECSGLPLYTIHVHSCRHMNKLPLFTTTKTRAQCTPAEWNTISGSFIHVVRTWVIAWFRWQIEVDNCMNGGNVRVNIRRMGGITHTKNVCICVISCSYGSMSRHLHTSYEHECFETHSALISSTIIYVNIVCTILCLILCVCLRVFACAVLASNHEWIAPSLSLCT